ncbi:MAG: type II toxin-antitoxin system RelE/ParE family toxin [Candidatus Nitrotoga sp.]
MAKYKITFKRSVAKDLRNITNADVKRILTRIDELSDDPRGDGCMKLSAQERYRVRVGLYRIIYEIQDSKLIVQVVKVGHRSNVY